MFRGAGRRLSWEEIQTPEAHRSHRCCATGFADQAPRPLRHRRRKHPRGLGWSVSDSAVWKLDGRDGSDTGKGRPPATVPATSP